MNTGEETIFAEALRLPPEERAAYVAQATAGNPKLRQEVESLLGSYQAGDFLERAAATQLRQTRHITVPLTEKPGDTIGRYKLLQQIGEGGCGVVYMAEQLEPVRRRVAIKIIKLGTRRKETFLMLGSMRGMGMIRLMIPILPIIPISHTSRELSVSPAPHTRPSSVIHFSPEFRFHQ